MEKKVTLTIVNTLLDTLLVPNVCLSYIIAGYKVPIILSALLGTIIGSILMIKYPLQKAIYWVLLGAAIISAEELYRYIVWQAGYIPPLEAWLLMLLIFLFFIGFAYVLLAFELWVADLFKKENPAG